MAVRPLVSATTAVAASAALAVALVAVPATTATAAGGSTGSAPLALPELARTERLAASGVVGTSTYRLSGADRYETAAEVSRGTWDESTAAVVFLASGEGFADALSAGPSSLGAGPLLLTTRDALPPATADELARLRPCVVVVVGGTAAVSDAVALRADALADPAKCGA